MKKRAIIMLLAISLVAVQPMTILGAGSSSGRTSSGESSSDSDVNYGQGSIMTVSNGLTTTKVDGQRVSGNDNVQAAFAVGTVETAGLPEVIVQTIHNINTGMDLNTATGNTGMGDYVALTTTSAIVLTGKNTGKASDELVEVSLYVPNLISGLKDIKILCYDNATGQWLMITPNRINFEKKVITFNMAESGTVTVVYYRES